MGGVPAWVPVTYQFVATATSHEAASSRELQRAAGSVQASVPTSVEYRELLVAEEDLSQNIHSYLVTGTLSVSYDTELEEFAWSCEVTNELAHGRLSVQIVQFEQL